jgi:hypothetical protein
MIDRTRMIACDKSNHGDWQTTNLSARTATLDFA